MDKVLGDLQATLLTDADARVLRQADFIEVAVTNVFHALRDGGILVMAIVLLFLANLRAAFITLTAIPLSLLTTVLVLKAFDATMNTMTLGWPLPSGRWWTMPSLTWRTSFGGCGKMPR